MEVFYVHDSVHRGSILITVQRDATQAVYLLFCEFTLHVWVVNHAHYQENTKT